MEQSNWAPEHSDALRELIARGMSFAEAARTINARYNTSYTRSAALGRARRLGIGQDSRAHPSMPTGPVDLHEIAEPSAGHFWTRPLPWPTPVFQEAVPVKLRCADVEPRHVSLIELEHGDCRYPYGGDEDGEPITFCGHPRRPGSQYCSPHFRLSRNPVALPDGDGLAAADADSTRNVTVSGVADSLTPLRAHHQIAHLRALIGLQPEGPGRRDERSELEHNEISSASIE